MGTIGIMIMKKNLIAIFFLILSLAAADQAQALMSGEGGMRPYGGYCRGPKWGWYGAGRHVRTVQEVRLLVEEFLKGTGMVVAEIQERDTYFEVRIIGGGAEGEDILIIDKRYCRIRSKY
jgi:hypothetical protein